jgi:uncharacterized protein (TIRG00374 family)
MPSPTRWTSGESGPAMPRRPWSRLALRALTLVAALVFLARGVHWHDLTGASRRVGILAPSLVLVLNACMLALRSIRLRILLRRQISIAASLAVRLTSSALNNLTPFRGGDVARLWMVERASGIRKPAAAAIAVVESLTEIAVLAPIGFSASFLVAGQRWATIATPLVFCLAIGMLVALEVTTGHAARTVACRHNSLARLRRFLGRLEPGFRALSEPRVLAPVLMLSLLAWSCETVMIFVCARAMGIEMSFALAAVVLVGINLALVLPSTPASAGPFEGAIVGVLMLAGSAKGPAVAFALFYHAIQVVPVTVVGATLLLMAKGRHVGRTGEAEMRAPLAERARLGA